MAEKKITTMLLLPQLCIHIVANIVTKITINVIEMFIYRFGTVYKQTKQKQ